MGDQKKNGEDGNQRPTSEPAIAQGLVLRAMLNMSASRIASHGGGEREKS